MLTDQTGVPVAEGDRVAVNPGMVDGVIVKAPSGLALPGQQPGQQYAVVQINILVPVLPNGAMPGTFYLPALPGQQSPKGVQ